MDQTCTIPKSVEVETTPELFLCDVESISPLPLAPSQVIPTRKPRTHSPLPVDSFRVTEHILTVRGTFQGMSQITWTVQHSTAHTWPLLRMRNAIY